MSRRGVIVRRLDAIENLGSMTVLCTDKTGHAPSNSFAALAAKKTCSIRRQLTPLFG
jgi:hypothetical protein